MDGGCCPGLFGSRSRSLAHSLDRSSLLVERAGRGNALSPALDLELKLQAHSRVSNETQRTATGVLISGRMYTGWRFTQRLGDVEVVGDQALQGDERRTRGGYAKCGDIDTLPFFR